MSLLKRRCPTCTGENFRPHITYTGQNGKQRQFYCPDSEDCFSQTKNTPMENLRTPLSLVQLVLDAFNNGMGINAVRAMFQVARRERLPDVIRGKSSLIPAKFGFCVTFFGVNLVLGTIRACFACLKSNIKQAH